MTLRDRLSCYRAPLLALLFGALLMRALVPAGWMPSANGPGVELCAEWGDDGAARAQAAEARRVFEAAIAGARSHGDQRQSDDHQGKDQPCAFAGLGLAWAAPELPVGLLPPSPPATTPFARRASVRIGEGLAAPPPPSTGPPGQA